MLRFIALFKLTKALVLLGVLAAGLHLVRHDPTQQVIHWARRLHVDPGNHYLQAFLARLLRADRKQLEIVAVGTALYALLFATEGIGLWLAKTWAEYMTSITTAGFIPLELYELVKKVSFTKSVMLTFNVGIVLYLVYYVRHQRLRS